MICVYSQARIQGNRCNIINIVLGIFLWIKYYSDAKGNKLNKSNIYVEPTNGLDLYLTINYNIQSSVERELNNVISKYNADGAWSIVMNPNNGEILAIASIAQKL